MPNDAWLLVGELHPRLFQLLKSGGQPVIKVTLLQANIGIFYVVVRHEIGDWEHRFVLPMARADIPDFVGDGAALAVESIASALQLLEPHALPPLQSSAEITNVCVTLVYTDELAAQLEVLSSLPFKH